jgi:hypothetical protein
MLNRKFLISLFSLTLLVEIAQSVQASSEESVDDQASSASSSEGEDESRDSTSESYIHPEITSSDLAYFKAIETTKVLIPHNNATYDQLQPLLKEPIAAELPYEKYLCLQESGDAAGTSDKYVIARLKSGAQVFIKRAGLNFQRIPLQPRLTYQLEDALLELVTPRIARAYFDIPTLPATELVFTKDGLFELRQHFIKGALPEDIEDEEMNRLLVKLVNKPQKFNRPFNFLFELSLFDQFNAAADRNDTNLLWVHCGKTPTRGQKWAFFAIDYEESGYARYNNARPHVEDMTKWGDTVQSTFDMPHTAPLSSLRKLDIIREIYPVFFKDATSLAPHHFNVEYFSVMGKWQKQVLKSFHGCAFDDQHMAFSVAIQSQKLSEKLLSGAPDEDGELDSIELDKSHQSH